MIASLTTTASPLIAAETGCRCFVVTVSRLKLGRPISGLCSGTNTVSAWLNSRAIRRMTRFRGVDFEHQGERVASKSG